MYSTKRGLRQAKNGTWKGSTECIAGVETVAGEVDDAGPRHRIDVALDCCLRLAARGASWKAACPGHCRVDRRQRSDRIQMPGIAHMISVNPQRILRANLPHVINREHAVLAQLPLHSGTHMDHTGRTEIGRQHTAEVRQTVRQRIHVWSAG